MRNMVLEHLRREYSYNEPIFINELAFEDVNYNNLRQIFKRLTDEGILERYDTGIYFFPKKSSILGKTYMDTEVVIANKFIGRGNRLYGYYSGLTFANQIGITTQVPVVKDIVTNKESSRGRTVFIKSREIRVKKPRAEVSNGNCLILQILDLINEYEKYSEYEVAKTYEIIAEYIKQTEIAKQKALDYLSLYPARVAKVLLESGLYSAFA